jgi:methylated-DNA-[protein]-cysteine S-methyltransferase
MSMMNGAPLHTVEPEHTTIESPLGELTVVAKAGVLVGLYFPGHGYMPDRSVFGRRSEDRFDGARRELVEYFAGERKAFDISLDAGGNELQRNVWDLVRQVPYGQTATYGHLARALDDGTTAQAVGVAVGRNPLCILIPCHRIVGSGGRLTGYAGGLGRKRLLLDLEKATMERPGTLF